MSATAGSERFRAGDNPANCMSPDSSNHQVTFVLECIECGARSDDGRGWRAYLDEDSSEVGIYCAECADREFGSA